MANSIFDIYKKLYKYFGPQNWWPAESAFEVMVGAILVQNTNWKNVEKSINNLKKAKLLNARKLYNLEESRIAQLIRPSGYYKIKAKRLKNFLHFFFREYNLDISRIKKTPFLRLRERLLCVNGIGPETADSILLYALDKPVFVVDAYTKRIFSRHKFIKNSDDYHLVQDYFTRHLNKNVRVFNEYHALIVKLAKDFCSKKKDKCLSCPLCGL
jgi:endonuclease-3 related protein